MERIVDVANYIYEEYKVISGGKHIDELKLHKLLYLAQRESLAITNEPLFAESMQGWVHGPVSPEVRNAYIDGDLVFFENINELKPENEYIVKSVLIQYGGLESWKLSELTHRETSWINSRNGLASNQPGRRELKIQDIREDSYKIRPYDPIWDMYYDEFDDFEDEAAQ